MKPSFGDSSTALGVDLLCPNCGNNYLHHDVVEVFECDEDASFGVHVTVGDGKAVMDTSLADNPSERRHGLKIRFWCEECDAKPLLSISQHKGNTYVNFSPTE